MDSSTKAKFERAKQGYFNGGVPPFGYYVDNTKKRLKVDPYEEKAILFIFDAITKDMSYEDISKCINALGYRTRTGRMFNSCSIQNILRNEIYTGVTTYHSSCGNVKLKQTHLRIITDAEFKLTKNLLLDSFIRNVYCWAKREKKLRNEE